MKLLNILLVCILLMAGCHVLSPVPGHLTQYASQEQMTAILHQRLKPGMSIEEARAFLKKEGFTVNLGDSGNSESDNITFTRRDQVDFWVHQDWTVTIDCRQGKVDRHAVKCSFTGP